MNGQLDRRMVGWTADEWMWENRQASKGRLVHRVRCIYPVILCHIKGAASCFEGLKAFEGPLPLLQWAIRHSDHGGSVKGYQFIPTQ